MHELLENKKSELLKKLDNLDLVNDKLEQIETAMKGTLIPYSFFLGQDLKIYIDAKISESKEIAICLKALSKIGHRFSGNNFDNQEDNWKAWHLSGHVIFMANFNKKNTCSYRKTGTKTVDTFKLVCDGD